MERFWYLRQIYRVNLLKYIHDLLLLFLSPPHFLSLLPSSYSSSSLLLPLLLPTSFLLLLPTSSSSSCLPPLTSLPHIMPPSPASYLFPTSVPSPPPLPIIFSFFILFHSVLVKYSSFLFLMCFTFQKIKLYCI